MSTASSIHQCQNRRASAGGLMGLTLAGVAFVYAVARVTEVLALSNASPLPNTALVAVDILSAMIFALVHGSARYGWRAFGIFFLLCAVVGNLMENLGVITGFPYGHYDFNDIMGPKLLHVPVLLGLAYVGMAYVSYELAARIVGCSRDTRPLAVPTVAAFVMVAWDLAMDPVWATVIHAWTWFDGGAWFGVPLTNYFGWYLTVFLIYCGWTAYLRRVSLPVVAQNSYAASGRNLAPVLFYLLCAAGNVVQLAAHPSPEVVHDGSGTAWHASQVPAASALISLLVMGGFAAIALLRSPARQTD